MEACHNDGNNLNNELENLRWDTHKNNIGDSIIHGTMVDNSGSRHGMSKLNESQVRIIKYLLKTKVLDQTEYQQYLGFLVKQSLL